MNSVQKSEHKPAQRSQPASVGLTDPSRIANGEDALLFMIDNHLQVSEICGITTNWVLQWSRIPARHCHALEKAFGIPRAVMRPDIYGDPSQITTDEESLWFMKLMDNHQVVREVCGGITRQAVLQWKRIPAQYCPALEKAFGIPRTVMRPDIYG
jgi:DNA-binding transcriptional regulator YdaS (Cro superfamily)